MQIVAWTLFWPELNSKNRLIFHIYRYIILILSLQVSTYYFPSILTWCVFILSTIEYTRNANNSWVLKLYFTFILGLFIRQKFIVHSDIDFTPNSIIYNLLRTTIYFSSIIFDRLTIKRFGYGSYISLFAYPILLAGSLEILSSIDQLGLYGHISTFFFDIPELNILVGSSGFAFFIGLISSSISQRKHFRLVPHILSKLHIRIIIVYVALAFSINYIVFKSTKTIKVSQIAEFPKLDITNESFKSDIYIITRQLKSFDLDYFSKVSNITKSFITFYYLNNCANSSSDNILDCDQILNVVTPSGEVKTRKVAKFTKKMIPFRLLLKDMLVSDSHFGNIGFIVGREMVKPEYFLSKDVAILITFGGDEYMERLNIPYLTRKIVSLMSSATRIHASQYSNSFAVDLRGKRIYTMKNNETENTFYEPKEIKITKNYLRFNGLRFLISEYIVFLSFLYVIFINILPMKYVRNLAFNCNYHVS